MASPAALYAALRGASGQEGRLPANPGLVLGQLWELPLAAAGALVLDRPAVGAFVAREGAGVVGIFGCRVRSGPEVVQALAIAGKPVSKDPTGDLSVLSGFGHSVFGVVDDWLLVSSDEPALRAAGLYVARALSQRALGPEPFVLDVGRSALRGPLEQVLRANWQSSRTALVKLAAQMQASQGRPPDFGDPSAILAKADANVNALLTTLAGAERLRLTLTPGDEELELALEVDPTPGGGVEDSVLALSPVPYEAILSLPAEAQLAALTRLSLRDLGLGEGALGTAASGPLVTGGSVTALALLSGPGVVVRYGVGDPAQAEKELAELVRGVGAAEPGAAFGPWFGKARVSTVSIPALRATAQRVQMPFAKPPASKSPPPAEIVDVLALVGKENLFVAVGDKDARALLAEVAEPPTARQLGHDPAVRALLTRHGGASTLLLANIGAVVRTPRPATGLFTWGRRERRARASLALSPGALAVVGGFLAR